MLCLWVLWKLWSGRGRKGHRELYLFICRSLFLYLPLLVLSSWQLLLLSISTEAAVKCCQSVMRMLASICDENVCSAATLNVLCYVQPEIASCSRRVPYLNLSHLKSLFAWQCLSQFLCLQKTKSKYKLYSVFCYSEEMKPVQHVSQEAEFKL